MSTAEERPATPGVPEIVEKGNNSTSISRVWTPTLTSFHGNSQKSCQNGKIFVKKDKMSKHSTFLVRYISVCPIAVGDIGSPILLAR
jgi:hypothetical protein